MMQNSPFSTMTQTVRLYRVCYRCKTTGATGKASGVDILEDAQKLVNQFNARYGNDFTYFAVPVSIYSVERQELLRLVREGKISQHDLPFNQPQDESY
jgi:hypothetical protein